MIHHALCPDLYKGQWTGEDAPEKYAKDVANLIDHSTSGNPACFIAESIQGAGGFVPLPNEGYLDRVYKDVRARGGLCIADEVQAGFGRVG